MPLDLRDRLNRIRLLRQDGTKAPEVMRTPNHAAAVDLPGWTPAGYMTMRREITANTGMIFPAAMPQAAAIVMPGIDGMTSYEELLFFDLETTGLSGGAGTVAFLAAFGRLIPNACSASTAVSYDLCITQYLLTDYPGESDFIQAVLNELNRSGRGSRNNTIVSYNGKTFDSQILKTRCLMNGFAPPEYRHADLLHPCRRLWKTLLPDCAQGTIETHILRIDRTGDTPGAMAPDIWFAFLKSGDTAPLMGICDHNSRDIAGLASIFFVLTRIAHDPFAAMQTTGFDYEALAIRWHWVTRERAENRPYASAYVSGACISGDVSRLRETGRNLLQFAAEKGRPRAGLYYALLLLRLNEYANGRKALLAASSENSPQSVRIAALRVLAIDSERRLRNAEEALKFAEQGLELLPPDSGRRTEFEHRIKRLRGKLPF